MKDGKEQVISESVPSKVRADWVAAHYVAAGYVVTINEEK